MLSSMDERRSDILNSPMCCISLQVRFLLACNANAQIPAASGADADVPVWPAVQE